MKKVMVFGTFDGVHPGHIFFLRAAKKMGNRLVAVIARDETVTKVKGRKPKQNEDDRLHEIELLRIADRVTLGHLGDKMQIVDEEKPDIIALGYDQEAFTDQLTLRFGSDIQISRIPAFHPEIYKSSKLAT